MDSKGKNIVDFGTARKKLNKKTKQEARDDKERQAQENRIRFGRTGAEKKKEKLDALRKQKIHDDHQKASSPKLTDKDSDK